MWLSNVQQASEINTIRKPQVSYAYSSGNSKLFGVDATYTFISTGFIPSYTPIGYVTPYLINSASPTLTCSPFHAEQSSQSLKCPVTGASIASGLYTVSFSQYTSTSTVDANGNIAYGQATGSNTLTNFGAAVTFSIVPPQLSALTTTITITPTPTASTTIISGVSETLASSTATIPASIQTISVYQTTIISTSTSLSTPRGTSLITVTGTCTKPPTTRNKPATTLLKCNADNCLRTFINKSSSASAFCNLYTNTQGISTPTFASQCSGLSSRVSSACTCLVQSTSVTKRGVTVNSYAPPDFAYSLIVSTVTVTATAGPVTTIISGPIPSATV
ncbi:hypothetical protein BDZ45DRAFT_774741 [Acephala macrosclerotiorum]|nr:hypothetical protein BDZ45DRAFT_774741 [Acephala macrosclerotiorum]